ncbi:MAG: signal transduction histidine kinase [Solidesulfovibrio magneticus str. Maddingley MBC34]|uniref:histidine kinase n=1 Tax=Solidesulfovibrio magneticus str. Maddingley MBC34 TaxID=1206767 RepID=K6FJA5_9BACT|nr:MAG: signal transduction histidine kinase [Solidesulfovibrio magneticus str. Maddingley MBC34]
MFLVFFLFVRGARLFRRGPAPLGVRARPRGWASLAAGLLLLLALAAPLGSLGRAETTPPRAKQGVIDLAGWDLAAQGPARLDGEWEYHPRRLFAPADFPADAPRSDAAVYVVPRPWNRAQADNEAMGTDAGFATLRLRIKPPPDLAQPALALFNINAAYRLWIDGRPTAGSGTVGTDAATEVPVPAKQIVPFPAAGRPVDIVLQVSNHHARDGGLVAPVLFGPRATLAAQYDREMALAMFFIGAFCLMGLHHAALYWLRPADATPLYFSLYCFAWMGNYAASDSSGWALRLFFPGLTARFLDPLALVCFFVTIPVGHAFFLALYPREFSRRVQVFCNVLCAVFVAVALFASGQTLNTALPLHYLASSLLIVYCINCLRRAWRQGRDEAGFLLAGFCVLGLIGLNDMLFDLKYLPSTSLLPVGMLVMSLCQSFALSHRFSRAFAAEERLSAALEDKNRRLETAMAARLGLEQKIVAVSEEERRRVSLELHDGLCQGLTAARLRCDVLSSASGGAAINGEALAPLSGLLDGLVDQAYDLSRGLWPLEHDGVGVGPSFREMIRRQAAASAIPIEFHREMHCQACRHPHLAQLYRIAQEAVANAVKHARAGRIMVSLACPAGREAILAVRDDGCGRSLAKASAGGLGLGIMAHRARVIGGELRIGDAPGGGTEVVCTAPCPDAAQDLEAAPSGSAA